MTRSALDRGARLRRGRGPAVLLLLGGLLAGCGGDGDGTGSDGGATATTAPSPTSSSPSPDGDGGGQDGGGQDDGGQDDGGQDDGGQDDGGQDDGGQDDGGQDDGGGAPQPPFPADTAPDTQQASADAFGNVTAIRIGRHDGFDRVVFEFHGTGTPGWDVRYTDEPARQGSGEAVDLEGDATLQVTVTGVGYPPDTGVDEYAGAQRLSARDTEQVTEVFFDGTFEGVTAALVGTASETPFRVYLLEDPARVVLEVADAS
ncbi:AMIN-like domain-containing (lipo)protein [Geodermatophilus sp. SYSU D00710]